MKKNLITGGAGFIGSCVWYESLEKTVGWYLHNEKWLNNVTSGNYQAYYNDQYKRK